jgi:hypothetical protein
MISSVASLFIDDRYPVHGFGEPLGVQSMGSTASVRV